MSVNFGYTDMALTQHQLRRLRQITGERNRLKAARELIGATQWTVAASIGISQSALSDLERHRHGATTVETAHRFAEYFGCSIEDLFPAPAAVAS